MAQQQGDGGNREGTLARPSMESMFQIIYFFPHASQVLSKASRFGWYTPGILAAAGPVMHACELPADIREASATQVAVLVHRLNGWIWPRLLPIEIDSLEGVFEVLETPFVVCATTSPEVADQVDAILGRLSTPVLHVSAVPGRGRIPSLELNNERLGRYVHDVVGVLASQPEGSRLAREAERC